MSPPDSTEIFPVTATESSLRCTAPRVHLQRSPSDRIPEVQLVQKPIKSNFSQSKEEDEAMVNFSSRKRTYRKNDFDVRDVC